MRVIRQKGAGAIASSLIVILLLAVAVGLYLQIILIDHPSGDAAQPPGQASLQVLEGDETPVETALPVPLPDDQVELILKVFDPEGAAQ